MPGLPVIYKRTQGAYTRSLTALCLALVLGAVCYFTFTKLVEYMPGSDPFRMAVGKADESYVIAKAWPNDEAPVYPEGTVVTPEVVKALQEAKEEVWVFRAAKPVPYALHLQIGIPVVLFVAGAVGIFYLTNAPRFADFLIATEGEMKKVSWSSKEELAGSTVVVIVTVLLLAGVIYLADMFWISGLKVIHVLPAGGQ